MSEGIIKFYNVPRANAAAKELLKCLKRELSNNARVLWLVPGGSNIALSVEIMSQIPVKLQSNLAIMLTDERFGPPGHADSNLQQLSEAGFEPDNATVIPVLVAGLSLEETCKRYAQAIEVAFKNADVIVGQFGMGADGHIAGILPGSPAVTSKKLVEGYDAGEFIRITLTPTALKQISAAYAFVFGEAKREALQNLQGKKLPLAEQPAQILKQIPESYVFNDQIGEAK